jgi:hypothetical protein
MNNILEPLVTVAAGVLGLAIIAVLVSKNAQTSSVIGATGSAFSNVITAADQPITGSTTGPNVNGPSSSGLSLGNLGGLNLGNIAGLSP